VRRATARAAWGVGVGNSIEGICGTRRGRESGSGVVETG
jgi:hypothetical protein